MDLAPLDLLASLLGLALCAVIVCIAEPAINRMHVRSASFLARLSLAMLVVGAVAGILEILNGHVPGLIELAVLTAGARALVMARREQVLAGWYDQEPTPKGHPHAQG